MLSNSEAWQELYVYSRGVPTDLADLAAGGREACCCDQPHKCPAACLIMATSSEGHFILCDLRFYNLKVASRGQTRKAPSAATWAMSLLELAKKGARDPQVIINSWNVISAKTDRVTGGKYMSVKMLLDLPVDVRDFLMSQISLYGFDGC